MVPVPVGSGVSVVVSVVRVIVIVVIGDLEGVGGLTLSAAVGRMRGGIHEGYSCEVQMLIFQVAAVVTVEEAAEVTVIPPVSIIDEITVATVWPRG